MTLGVRNMWQNRRAESPKGIILACWQNSYAKIVRLGRAACADHAPKPLCTASCQAPHEVTGRAHAKGDGAWRTIVSYAQDVPKLCDTGCFCCHCMARTRFDGSRLVPKVDRADGAKM